jgi:hypothetical protein
MLRFRRGFPICSATWGYLITNVSSVKEERNRRFPVLQVHSPLIRSECDSLRYPEWELADLVSVQKSDRLQAANKANHR